MVFLCGTEAGVATCLPQEVAVEKSKKEGQEVILCVPCRDPLAQLGIHCSPLCAWRQLRGYYCPVLNFISPCSPFLQRDTTKGNSNTQQVSEVQGKYGQPRRVGTRHYEALAPELQVKVFEALPSPPAVLDLALTYRSLSALFAAYKTQIIAAIRDSMVAPFYEYYAFLGRLHIPESAFKHPPAGGWPNITPENCARLGKSNFAVDVLRHLPYVVEYYSGRHDELTRHDIDYCCEVVDYSRVTRQGLGSGTCSYGYVWKVCPPLVARHCVYVARGYGAGVALLLDTSTGLVFERGDTTLRLDGALPVQERFALKTRQCRELRQAFDPGESASRVGRDGEVPPYDAAAMEEAGGPSFGGQGFDLKVEIDKEWVRHLYRKFGWPGEDWRREEGLKAIIEYMDRRNADSQERQLEADRKRREVLLQLGPRLGRSVTCRNGVA